MGRVVAVPRLLLERTGQRTVPSVWLDGKHIGGADDTVRAVESGMLDEDEAVHHEERHLISNVVGADDMRIEIGLSINMAAKDTLLLASDGLFDNLYLNEIIETNRINYVCLCLLQ